MGRRYQNVHHQPRQILRSLDGYEFRESGGVGFLLRSGRYLRRAAPETSAAIIDRKTGFIKDTGATVVATECRRA